MPRCRHAYSFYNAGLTAWTFTHLRCFLELVTADGYAPKVLFFNFDCWMFSKGFDHSTLVEIPAEEGVTIVRQIELASNL